MPRTNLLVYLGALAGLTGVAATQTSFSCDMFVTEESPARVFTFHGLSGLPTGLFAQAAAGIQFQGFHHGSATQPVLVGTVGHGVREYHRTTGAYIKSYNAAGGWQWAGVFAPNGDVLIGDHATNDIRRYNPTTGLPISTFAQNINGPGDMVFGPNGNLFVCGYLGGGVYELNGTTGTQVMHWVPTLPRPNDIVFMPDGRRIVTSSTPPFAAYVYDANWNQIALFAGTNWGRPHGIDLSPHDGHIYVADGITNAVHRFDPTTYVEVNPAFVFLESKIVDVEFRRFGTPICGNVVEIAPGCGGLQLANSGRPEIGNTLTLRVNGAPALTPAFLTIGDSRTQWNGITLPLPLGGYGAPGCSLLVSPLVFLPTAANATGTAEMPIALPAAPHLVGADIFFQWLAIDRRANAWGITTSAGTECRVGRE